MNIISNLENLVAYNDVHPKYQIILDDATGIIISNLITSKDSLC